MNPEDQIIAHVAEHLGKDVEWVKSHEKEATELLKKMFHCPCCDKTDKKGGSDV